MGSVTHFHGTTEMLRRAGYDDMGNAPHLVAEQDRLVLERGGDRRVGGDALCSCGSEYRLHPLVQGALWLHRSCDGLVKL
jgi:hypothetical protein